MDVVKLLNVHLLLYAPSQVDQCGFASAVARAVGDDDGSGSRGNVEHAPAALFPELWDQQTHQVIWPIEVDGDVIGKVLWV